MSEPLVSISCVCYNHSRFLRQCLDGFIMQKTNFPFEVVIHDDASTDGSSDIIHEYELNYPDLIHPIYQTENQWRKDTSICVREINKKIRGKYIATCDGDDYWTDPLKLQKQVDFLETHQDYSICHHRFRQVFEDGSHPNMVIPPYKQRKLPTDLNSLLQDDFIGTLTVMYRRYPGDDRPEEIPDNIMPLDWYRHLLYARHGKIGFLPDVMATYRIHRQGIWCGVNTDDRWFMRQTKPFLFFYKTLEQKFGHNASEQVISLLHKAIPAYLRLGANEELIDLKLQFPDLIKKALNNTILTKISDKERERTIYRKRKRKYKRVCCLLSILLILMAALYFWTICQMP